MRISPLLSLFALGIGVSCTPRARVVQVTASDYALQAPDSVSEGMLQLTFANRGQVPHEVAIGLLRPNVGNREMVAAGQHGVRLREASEHYLEGAPYGVLFAWPGQASPARLSLVVRRGQRYALFCTFRDSLAAPEHAAMGMVRVLVVR